MRTGIALGVWLFVVPLASSCGPLLGPSCLSRQERGAVTSISGTVTGGVIVMHEVGYGTDGSQNDLAITWSGQHTPGGPRLRVYATRIECTDFTQPDPGQNRATGACAAIGSHGGFLSPDARACAVAGTCAVEETDIVQTSLTITNGRGNPDVLGSPARYRLWVVGSAPQAVQYGITITFFYGPDC